MMFCVGSFLLFSCGETKKNHKAISEVDSPPQVSQQETTASRKLSESPRHHEWVTLSHGDREFDAFVVYPETEGKTKAVIVIHENRGLNDWARLFSDKLAARGYLVIAPDL